MRYELAQASRVGDRMNNQDRTGLVERRDAVLLTVADGMGGHPAGDFAAETVVDKAREVFEGWPLPVRDPPALFREVIERAHNALVAFAQERGLSLNPGSTAVLCLVQEGRAHWAHVGDSRLYLLRNGQTLRRTRDQSYVEGLYQQGLIGEEEMATHPLRSQVTECVGCQGQPPAMEVARAQTLHRGDVLLLCSDGLWGALPDAELGGLLAEGTLSAGIERAVQRAEWLAHPFGDNIAAVGLRLLESSGEEGETTQAQDRPSSQEGPATLEDAIERIEEVMREYDDELTRGGD